MKISIIVPVHNAQETIARCAASLVEQEDPDLEILLIHDRSEDNSLAICRQLECADSRIRVLETEGEYGASGARNVGLAHATGDVIGFCDADDTLADNALMLVRQAFLEHPEADVLVGGLINICPEAAGERWYRLCYSSPRRWTGEQLLAHVQYDRKIMGSVWNKYFRREMLGDIRFSAELTYMEDTHFVSQVLSSRKDAKVYVLSEVLYHYYNNPAGVTNQANRLFDGEGRLKYVVAVDKILTECGLSSWAACLARRSRYILASDTWLNFNLDARQIREVKALMRRDRKWFLLLWFINSKENVRRMLRTGKKMLTKREGTV